MSRMCRHSNDSSGAACKERNIGWLYGVLADELFPCWSHITGPAVRCAYWYVYATMLARLMIVRRLLALALPVRVQGQLPSPTTHTTTHNCFSLACRLHSVDAELASREREINELREQLQREIQAEAQHAAGQAAELAGERAALQKQAAALDQEREAFNAWRKEMKEEAQRQLKVGRMPRTLRSRGRGVRGRESTRYDTECMCV